MYKNERFKYLVISNECMIEESIFLVYVGDNPRMRILQYLIEGRDFDYTLTDMLNSRVSWGTLNSLVPKLLALDIIIKTRKIGRATLYKINKNSFVAKKIIDLYDKLIKDQLDSLDKPKEKMELLATH